jgi:apolipoprotein N-acyltransferase
MHAVPLGEYLPLRETFPWVKNLSPYDFEYSITEGRRFTRFPLPAHGETYSFGVQICSETADPALARVYAGSDGQPPADFLVELSNDAWFDGTAQPLEHLALARFRAIETRRPLVRAVNFGVPAVVDGNGRVLRPRQTTTADGLRLWEVDATSGEWPASEWAEATQPAGVMLATIPLDRRGSFYARCGDWLPWGCWGLLAVGMAWAVFAPKRQAV